MLKIYLWASDCNTYERLILGGYIKVRESLDTRVIIGVNTILDHIGTRVISPTYEGSCMVYGAKLHLKKS